ncbi:MAG TPA: hypothetical protein PK821_08395 [Victivallales bacterium]|nr:hypothetical protein [Victivallales bacterium]
MSDSPNKNDNSERFKAFALNLLYPGAGQFFLKRWLAGTIFFLLASVAVFWLGWIMVEFFMSIYRMAMDGLDFDETARFRFIRHFAASSCLLCIIWLASFAEIFASRRILESIRK